MIRHCESFEKNLWQSVYLIAELYFDRNGLPRLRLAMTNHSFLKIASLRKRTTLQLHIYVKLSLKIKQTFNNF
jgi:hypothetical protein